MKKIIVSSFFLLVYNFTFAQVASITPTSAFQGQTLTTTITLASGVMMSASPPIGTSDIYLQQGSNIIYTTYFDQSQIYPSPIYPYFSDSLTTNFTIPSNAVPGWYDVHVISQGGIPNVLPILTDNILPNGFLVRLVNSCTVPSGISVSNITNTGAQINWNAQVADTFRIRYKTGSSAYQYKDVDGAGSVVNSTLLNLLPGTTYTIEVSTKCQGVSSTYSIPIVSFTTLPITISCVRPNGIFTNSITNNSAAINWTNYVTADTFRIRYSVSGSGNYRYINYDGTLPHVYTLQNLQPATTYDIQVSSICLGVSSGYSPAISFVTSSTPVNCVRPWGLSSSNTTNISASLSWSPYVVADTFRIRYREVSGGNYIYVNKNGSGSNNFTLSNLQANTAYFWQVSSICLGVSSGYSSTSFFTTLNIPVACSRPHSLSVSNITNVSALISWSNLVSADTFRIRYSEVGSGINRYLNQPGTSGYSAILSGLNPNTNYQFQISSICTGTSSGYSTMATFSTSNVPVACTIPYNLTSTNITNSTADISWTPLVTADSFLVRYSVNGSTSYLWKKISGAGGINSTTLTSLLPLTTYQWQVRTLCNGQPISSYSSLSIFGTPLKISRSTTDLKQNIEVYPNPAHDRITIYFTSSENEKEQIFITDISGKKIIHNEIKISQGENIFETDISQLSPGIYFLIISDGSHQEQKRIIVY